MNAVEINKKKEEIARLKKRTEELFEIISMCGDDEKSIQVCRNEIIETNIRLVPLVLKKYRPYGDDEFQLGCLGLIMAARTFKAERGVPFANYACFCIERELHKAHRKVAHSIEYQLGTGLSSLDEALDFQNGDEADKHDTIADAFAEEVFDKILMDNCLDTLFADVIEPSIDQIAQATKGQASIDFDLWKALELRYILEMAEVDSQQARITFTKMAKELGVSVQNVRIRHQRVINNIKQACIDLGMGV